MLCVLPVCVCGCVGGWMCQYVWDGRGAGTRRGLLSWQLLSWRFLLLMVEVLLLVGERAKQFWQTVLIISRAANVALIT